MLFSHTIDRVAHAFVEKIRAYRHANDRISEVVVRVESIWVKTEVQVTALSNVQDRSNERLRQFHEECLRRLITKLCAADAEVETFLDTKNEDLDMTRLAINHGPIKRIRYSLFESHLRKTIDSLEAWHAIFDPSFFLITLHNDEAFDLALQCHPKTLPEKQDVDAVVSIRNIIQKGRGKEQSSGSMFRDDTFLACERELLPNSSLALSKLSQSNARVLIDTTAYPAEFDRNRILTHVRDLARLLSCSQPSTLGLLQCLGVVKQFDTTGKLSQFRYVFAIPTGPSQSPISRFIEIIASSRAY